MRGQNNVQGVSDMGALPNFLPGYARVSDPADRDRFEKAWGAPIPGNLGLTIVEMINAAAVGEIKGLYFMGENPAMSDPDAGLRHAGAPFSYGIELLCSAGIPAVYTQVLALSDLSASAYYGYLLLYITVFLLDDAVVFVTAMLTLQATGLAASYSRYSHLIGGIVLVGVGLLLVFRPGWLAFA